MKECDYDWWFVLIFAALIALWLVANDIEDCLKSIDINLCETREMLRHYARGNMLGMLTDSLVVVIEPDDVADCADITIYGVEWYGHETWVDTCGVPVDSLR